MHKNFYSGIALLTGLACLTGVSAHAGYDSPEQITVNLNAVNGGYIPQNNVHQVYISPEDAQNGTTAHFGIWFETDPAIVDICVISMEMQCDTIEFVKDSYHSPTNYAFQETQEFLHTDGNIYSSRFQPYCFGRINDMGRYEHGASFCMTNINTNVFYMEWDYDYNLYDENGNRIFSTAFFGGDPSYYSFIEFDVHIPAGTPAGRYPIKFTNLDITSDDSIVDEAHPGKFISYYSHTIPVMYNAEVIVTDGSPLLEEDIQPVFRYAEDVQEFSVLDFPELTNFVYQSEGYQVLTEDLLEFFEAGSPADLPMDEPFKILRSELSWDNQSVQDSQGNPAALEYRVGLRGDSNLDGVVNASDAALILKYAAANGAGTEAFLTENPDSIDEDFARFLGDIDGVGESPFDLDASDAARILKYAAIKGSGMDADWNDIA